MMQKVFLPVTVISYPIKLILGRGFKAIIVLAGLLFLISIPLELMLMQLSPLLSMLIGPYLMVGFFYVLLHGWKDKELNSNGALGKAKFADLNDLKTAGLIGNGVVFGKKNGQLIEKPSSKEGHTLIIGGTGSGKGRGHAIPTLLRWQGTGLIIDIKGELSEKTAHTKENAIIFSTDEQLARYNPLDFVEEIEDVQDIARTLFPTPEKGDPFWSNVAQSIYSAAAWEFKETKSFADVALYLCETTEDEIINTFLASEKMETRILANTVTNMKKETLAGVFAEVRSRLATIAIDKNIRYATSASDFSPADIENSTIYLKILEHRLKQFGPLLGVITSQYLKYLTKRPEGKQPAVLIQLDEFPRLGKMSEIVGGLATLRSRNVHLMLVIQSLAQLDQIYGNTKRKVIVDNCNYKMVLIASDTETQKYFSEMAGMQTIKVQTFSQDEGVRKEQKFSTSEQSVPLIRPEEFGQLERPILFASRLRPVELEQAFWDQDSEMRSMVESKTIF